MGGYVQKRQLSSVWARSLYVCLFPLYFQNTGVGRPKLPQRQEKLDLLGGGGGGTLPAPPQRAACRRADDGLRCALCRPQDARGELQRSDVGVDVCIGTRQQRWWRPSEARPPAVPPKRAILPPFGVIKASAHAPAPAKPTNRRVHLAMFRGSDSLISPSRPYAHTYESRAGADVYMYVYVQACIHVWHTWMHACT